MATGGGGSSGFAANYPDDDPLLDFFDLSKPFERVTLCGGMARGRVK